MAAMFFHIDIVDGFLAPVNGHLELFFICYRDWALVQYICRWWRWALLVLQCVYSCRGKTRFFFILIDEALFFAELLNIIQRNIGLLHFHELLGNLWTILILVDHDLVFLFLINEVHDVYLIRLSTNLWILNRSRLKNRLIQHFLSDITNWVHIRLKLLGFDHVTLLEFIIIHRLHDVAIAPRRKSHRLFSKRCLITARKLILVWNPHSFLKTSVSHGVFLDTVDSFYPMNTWLSTTVVLSHSAHCLFVLLVLFLASCRISRIRCGKSSRWWLYHESALFSFRWNKSILRCILIDFWNINVFYFLEVTCCGFCRHIILTLILCPMGKF